ncbi:MAG: PHB depolymerase family esterase [bacterium]
MPPDAAQPDAAQPDAAQPDAEAEVVAPAEPHPYTGGECPTFEAGRNTFTAGGRERTFNLYLPAEPTGAPLLFMWHPLGSNAGQIASFLRAADAARDHGLVIAVPESLRTQAEWGYVGAAADDLALFDDLYACLTAQFGLDRTRTYTTGFSAGALWSSYLVVHRAEYLTAALILSGGTNAFLPYRTPAYRLPVLLAWGGPTDQYGGVVDFQQTTFDMRDHLRADGHFVVTCEHAGGHVPPPGVAGWGYAFLTQHRIRDTQSPLTAADLEADYPAGCTLVP